MLTGLSIRKFQSWKAADIELAPITVIVGRGNTGKSALLRAIKYALSNKGGDDFIRFGAGRTSVGISFDDGTILQWDKPRGAGATYTLMQPGLQDMQFTKTGTTVPVPVAEAARIRPLEVEKGSVVWPQLRLQFDGPFLVDETGTRTARILGKLTKLDVLVSAQMRVRRDRDRADRESKMLAEQCEKVRASLDALPDMQELWGKYETFQEATVEAEAAEYLYSVASQAARSLDTQDIAPTLKRYITAGRAALDTAERLDRARVVVSDYLARLDRAADAALNLDSLREMEEAGCCR